MQTDFFCKKYIVKLACALIVAFVACFFSYAEWLKGVQIVEINTAFYFLVTDDTRVEAGAAFVKLEGGAGYLLNYEGEEYVVLSAYLQKSDGETVQAALAQNGKTTQLLSLSVERLYLKKAKDKRNARMYKNALQTLRSCMQVMEECINRLEGSMTQESCKRTLSSLTRQFEYLSKIYKDCYPAYANVCNYTAQDISFLQDKTVYARDLRYVLCCLAVDYVALGEAFSL